MFITNKFISFIPESKYTTMENLNENQGRSDEQYIQDAKAASLGCSLIVIGIIVLAFYGLVKLIF